MKVCVDFSTGPDSAEWATVLADDGWKITHHSASQVTAENKIGNSATYPPRQLLEWYFTVTEVDLDEVQVIVEVPVFADSIYSRQRLLETVEEYAIRVNGKCEPMGSFKLPLLDELQSDVS